MRTDDGHDDPGTPERTRPGRCGGAYTCQNGVASRRTRNMDKNDNIGEGDVEAPAIAIVIPGAGISGASARWE
ncbi:hypothetical protein [Rhodopila globiformis]|uniref:hypothetical protein n=1 Tax=Rhodopila globiformis TaxID=1071 RepID=UPI0011B082FA|nr:hypothetical protein [Rhodopila globiformis]